MDEQVELESCFSCSSWFFFPFNFFFFLIIIILFRGQGDGTRDDLVSCTDGQLAKRPW